MTDAIYMLQCRKKFNLLDFKKNDWVLIRLIKNGIEIESRFIKKEYENNYMQFF